MPDTEDLLSLDYLVYSAHKTATQSVVAALRAQGLRAQHCHFLANLGLEAGGLRALLPGYLEKHGRRLEFISVFRHPLERLVSSYFQWYGVGMVRYGQEIRRRESIIEQLSVEALVDHFLQHYVSGRAEGGPESLDELCAELGVKPGELHWVERAGPTTAESGLWRLHLLRFDLFTPCMARVLAALTGREPVAFERNTSAAKWYAPKYRDFKRQLRLSPQALETLYEDRRHWIELFYPGAFEAMLAADCRRHAPAA